LITLATCSPTLNGAQIMLPAAIPKRYVVSPRRDIVELGTPSSTVMLWAPEMPDVYADEYKTLCTMSAPTTNMSFEKLTLYNSRSYKRRWYVLFSKRTNS
jgi:hypothetical protein